MNNEGKLASRVTLVDAVDLDLETYRILKDQLLKATRFLSARFLVNWEAEMDALLRYGIWRLSICKHGASFGQQLLRVKYGDELTRNKARLLVILTVGCSYLKQKISHLSSTAQHTRSLTNRIKSLLFVLESAVLAASIVNLIVFLHDGRYPTLIDRVLKLRPVSVAIPGASRTVGYHYMTRELLWHGFIELITFTVPLVNYQSIRQTIASWFSQKHVSRQRSMRTGVYASGTLCAICNDVPVLPHHIGCRHTFCYYCLQTTKVADSKFECSKCQHSADEIVAVAPIQHSRHIAAQ